MVGDEQSLIQSVRKAYRSEVENSLKDYIPEVFSSLQSLVNFSRNMPAEIAQNYIDNVKRLVPSVKVKVMDMFRKRQVELDQLFNQILEWPLFFEHLILGNEQTYAHPVFPENMDLFGIVKEYQSAMKTSLYSKAEKLNETLQKHDSNKTLSYVKDVAKKRKIAERFSPYPFSSLYIAAQVQEEIRDEIERLSNLVMNKFPDTPECLYSLPCQLPKNKVHFEKIRIEPKEPFALESFDDFQPLDYEAQRKARIGRLKDDMEHYRSGFTLSDDARLFVDYMQKNWIDVVGELEGKEAGEVQGFIEDLFAKQFLLKVYNPEKQILQFDRIVRKKDVEEDLYRLWRHDAYRKVLEDNYMSEMRKLGRLQRPKAYDKLVVAMPQPSFKMPQISGQTRLDPVIIYSR